MHTNIKNLLLLFSLFSFSTAIYGAESKNPNSLLLACGSGNGGKDSDGRAWESDKKYLVKGEKSVETKAEIQDPSLSAVVPYMTGRIFTSETTYQLPVQNATSRTLLRLYFYPSSYPNFNISNSYFSVVAGGVTLVNNFSAFLTAEALSQAYFIKEYFLAPSEFSTLNVTFKPSDKQPQSFAFVNGIEVISAPELFSREPVIVGTGEVSENLGWDAATTTVSLDGISIENMYRLNVGGQYISPVNDSGGLTRSWYDDTPYLFGATTGVADKADVPIGYKGLPSYTAPLDVYSTFRNIGPYADINKGINMTWRFQVDPNFMYLVRLHWCDDEMTKSNERVFDVYINNQTAATSVDLFAWQNSVASPTTRDYAIRVANKSGDAELWLTLRPNVKESPLYVDVLLNGLEIFKLSESNLAGPNPTISDMMRKYQEKQATAPKAFAQKSSTTTMALITGAAGGAAAFGVAAAIFLVAHKKKQKVPGDATSWLPISWNSSTTSGTKSSVSGKSQGSTTISSDAASNCRYFTLAEIKNGTKNFDDSNVIGVGGFGKVYKGVIDGDTKVAIKRSNPSSEQGVNEFQTEIEMLSRLRHRHLVSLIGFCEDNGEMILVYDYMGKGTLREHLYKGNKITLSWKQRLEICIGAAKGLHYLHTGAKYTIIHRDVKTTNILVDDKWVAKVSDFGLSKTGPNMNKGHVSTVVKGSFGYLDPEYFRRQQLTEKSDVYSFGVVLFEVLCARPALNPSLPKEQVSLADWALRCARNKTLEDIVDPELKGKITPECLKKFTETAEKCLSDHGVDRPSMGDVLWNLECALQLQENPDSSAIAASGGRGRDSGSSMDHQNAEEIDQNNLIAMHRNTLNLGNDDSNDSPDESTNDIFSQIANPKGL
ncbi:receptor-like protein kinase ANXUR1 [Olea europaea var. sylvestris]|uniref:receptor-like protein kinase ANXUR1 n=1 Tax=Olea europaea var. sylvestris TaxID=158386 RepID=UPI000C1D584C|nr:receptor-like protein kinase ANXUR1 [Olea europaea var. sylvestris]